MRLVQVEWVDSHIHDENWVQPDELKKTELAHCLSVGYLVQDEPAFITLAQSQGVKDGEVEEYGQPLTIPRVAITQGPDELVLLCKPRLLPDGAFPSLTSVA